MKYIVITFCISLIPLTSWADSWKCSNSLNEIHCHKNTCKANSPITSNFNINIQDNHKISVCSEHKCWVGAAKKSNHNQELYLINQFGWSVQHQSNTEYLLGVNHANNSLYLQNNSQKFPLQCELT